MITTTIVTSKDGIKFSVSFYSRSDAQARIAEITEARFAASKFAWELDCHGDYRRMGLNGFAVEPAPKLPGTVRASLTLIQGGKS